MPRLLYQGHGSFRITADDGRVIYVDPAFGDGYEKAADLILITHGHGDHNRLELCAKKKNCRVITNSNAIVNNTRQHFDYGWVKITAVKAENNYHDPHECVGYIIKIDGVKIYASGDTSKTNSMERFAARKIDYALFCGDGVYNMNPVEAAECAELVGASHNILYHMVADAKALFDREIADSWTAPNKLIIEAGEEIELFPSDLEKEVRRLKRLNKELDGRIIIKNKQIEVLHGIFYSADKTDLREGIFSLADEFLIRQEEADARRIERLRKKHDKIFEEAGEVTPLVADMLDGEVAVLGANIPGLVTRWYKKKANSLDKFDEKIYVSVSEKLAEILDAENRREYRAEQRHESHLDITASKRLTETPDKFDDEYGVEDFGGNPIIALIREEQERIRQLTLVFRERELAEIKAIIVAKLPPSQGIYYYYSKYENLPNTRIAEICGVSKQNVGDKLKLAKIKAFQLCLDKLQASEELQAWYRTEKEKLRFYTK